MRLSPRALTVVAAAAAVLLSACSGPKKFKGDDEPTLASLSQRQVAIAADAGVVASEERTMAAYRRFLEVAPGAPQRAEAMRRLGDLEMDLADSRAAAADTAASAMPDYKAAVARYQQFLKTYPRDKGNDRVLYQLARAHEQAGELEQSLKVLDRLVAEHPATPYADEAHFRRGEMLFSLKQYAHAERAFATVLNGDAPSTAASGLRPRALYMQGWSLFKLNRLEESLTPFFAVLDLQLGTLGDAARDEVALDQIAALSRADRELVEDTFRVVSIGFSQLQGAASIAAVVDAGRHVASDAAADAAGDANANPRRGYEFRVYQQLGELYLQQDRIKDAADTYALFVQRRPLHALSPLLLSKVIEIYAGNGFETLALESKKDFVVRYGVAGDFRRANAAGWQRAQPLVMTHLTELARHHHAAAQKAKGTAGYTAHVHEAIRWYRLWLDAFPADAATPQNHFLLAELLFENKQFAEAFSEYTRVAYDYPAHARSADAGYAALLAAAATAQRGAGSAAEPGLRFARTFGEDPRAAAVLVNAAETLFAARELPRASAVARQALARHPAPAEADRRTAWTVVAHAAFESGAFADAEKAYAELLALNPAPARRAEAAERLAASIYQQGEQARASGDAQLAVGHFARVGAVAGLGATAAVRATALYDTAAVQFGLKNWAAATKSLEDFRRQHAGHALQRDVAGKLAVAYFEQGRWSDAAAEFETVAAASHDASIARSAWWQAAELRDKAATGTPALVATTSPVAAQPVAKSAVRGQRPAVPAPVLPPASPRAAAVAAWERYLSRYATPLAPAVDARWRLAALTREQGEDTRSTAWLQQLRQAELQGGAERTDRTRTLSGLAALSLAEPTEAAYRRVALVEPLAKNLKLKKARLEEALAAYAAAAQDGMAEVTTAATFKSAALYADFGSAMLKSERPKKLKKAELDQYDVLLEEQAFPFEEKAIALHETNAGRTQQGVWNEWVAKSFAELARFKPVRYGKAERGRADAATVATLEAARATRAPGAERARVLNQLGIARREAGRFDAAREAYEEALALDPRHADARMNLAILNDLYLGQAEAALVHYLRCLELAPADAPQLNKWVAELRTRKPAVAAVASAPSARKEKE